MIRVFYFMPFIVWCIGMGLVLFHPHNIPEWTRERLSEVYIAVAIILFVLGVVDYVVEAWL